MDYPWDVRLKDAALGLAGFLLGLVIGAGTLSRVLWDLMEVPGDEPRWIPGLMITGRPGPGEAPAGLFSSRHIAPILLLGVLPFLFVLRAARRRWPEAAVPLPSFLSGFLWLPFQWLAGAVTLVPLALLRIRPGRSLLLGLGILGVMVVIPAVLEYFAIFGACVRRGKGAGRNGSAPDT